MYRQFIFGDDQKTSYELESAGQDGLVRIVCSSRIERNKAVDHYDLPPAKVSPSDIVDALRADFPACYLARGSSNVRIRFASESKPGQCIQVGDREYTVLGRATLATGNPVAILSDPACGSTFLLFTAHFEA